MSKDFKEIFEKQREYLDWFFSNYDIYHVNNCPWKYLERDACIYRNSDLIRNRWIYGIDGFNSQIRHFSNFMYRLIEVGLVGDIPDTLRQRYNIIDTLFKCNFSTNNPIHTTPTPMMDNLVLDFQSDDFTKFNLIGHPGQTRIQGSCFLKNNLDNVFVYKRKDDTSYTIKMTDNVSVINSYDQLIKHYKPFDNSDSENIMYIFTHDTGDESMPFKYHKRNKNPILKVYYMLKPTDTGYVDLSTTVSYMSDNFRSFNKFCRILFSDEFKVYTDNRSKLTDIFNRNRNALYNNISISDAHFNKQIHIDNLMRSNNLFNNKKPKNIYQSKSIINDLTESETELFETLENHFKSDKNLFESNTKVIFDIYNIKKNISESDYDSVFKMDKSGFSIWISSDIDELSFYRDLSEIIMISSTDDVITKSEDGLVQIINHSHSYWKTGNDYSERIIPHNFLYLNG